MTLFGVFSVSLLTKTSRNFPVHTDLSLICKRRYGLILPRRLSLLRGYRSSRDETRSHIWQSSWTAPGTSGIRHSLHREYDRVANILSMNGFELISTDTRFRTACRIRAFRQSRDVVNPRVSLLFTCEFVAVFVLNVVSVSYIDKCLIHN